MRIAILHNRVAHGAGADETDVLVQAECVRAALARAGHTVTLVPVEADLNEARRSVQSARPECVFNLVEAMAGSDHAAPAAALVVEAMGVPLAGCSAAALVTTNDKIAAKRRMRAAGVPTPQWLELAADADAITSALAKTGEVRAWIVKARTEHASIGMDDRSVVAAQHRESPGALAERIAAAAARIGRPAFAEAFVAGREFNLSVLDSTHGAQVLPPVEIDFSTFPAGKPHIVGYAAKWQAGSFEYEGTPRICEFNASDQALLDELQTLARRVWDLFDLAGHARVDFRVDEQGRPLVLEVNGNPCLSPDAGFAFALTLSGLTLDDAILRILETTRA